MNKLGYAMGQQVLKDISQGMSPTFSLLDREWDQLEGVFGGDFVWAGGLFASWLPVEEADSFLEIGSGNGLASVLAALRGCAWVTAVDINPAAVDNTRINAQRHGVSDQVRVLESDLFSAIGKEETFDLIYWDSPFIEAPSTWSPTIPLEYAFFDPGYAMHRNFLRAAPAHLTDRGRIFLGFSNAMGNANLLYQFAHENELHGNVYNEHLFSVPSSELGPSPEFAAHADAEGLVHLDFTLIEFRRNH